MSAIAEVLNESSFTCPQGIICGQVNLANKRHRILQIKRRCLLSLWPLYVQRPISTQLFSAFEVRKSECNFIDEPSFSHG